MAFEIQLDGQCLSGELVPREVRQEALGVEEDRVTARRQDLRDAEIPFDAVCFKDASGTAVPSKVYETIREARKLLPGCQV